MKTVFTLVSLQLSLLASCGIAVAMDALPVGVKGTLCDVWPKVDFEVYSEPNESSKKVALVKDGTFFDVSGRVICKMEYGTVEGSCSHYLKAGWYNTGCDATWFVPYFESVDNEGKSWRKIKTKDYEGWVISGRFPNQESIASLLKKFSGRLVISSPIAKLITYDRPGENPRLLMERIGDDLDSDTLIVVREFEIFEGTSYVNISAGESDVPDFWIKLYSNENTVNLWLRQGCH